MNKRFMLLVSLMLTMFTSSAVCRVLHKDYGKPGYKPAWLKKTIIPEKNFIYSVGHSRPCRTEKQAKDEALADATEAFIKYCKVDVQAFDRSIEVYSKNKGSSISSSDIQAKRIIRSKAFVTRAIPEAWYIDKKKKKYTASVLLKVPKEEFDRIVNEKDIKLSLDILFYWEDANGKMKVFDEASVLSSGDGYAVYLRPSDTCYIYVYQVDALGKTFRLFPNRAYKTERNPVALAEDLWIPNEKQLYVLDETTGKEYFYIFASPDPIEEFEGKNAVNLTKKYIDNLIEIKKMGAAGIKDKRDASKVPVPKRTRKLADIKRKLQAEGAFVYETWFWHK